MDLPASAELELRTATRRFASDFEAEGVSMERGTQRSLAHITAPTVTLRDLEVRSSERGKVTVKLSLRKDAVVGEQYEVVFTQRLGPLVVGRLSCLINVKES